MGGFRVHCQRGPMVYKFVFLKLKNHRTNLSTNMTCTYESLDVLMFTCRWGKGSPGERRLLKRGWSRWVRWERALHRLSRWVVEVRGSLHAVPWVRWVDSPRARRCLQLISTCWGSWTIVVRVGRWWCRCSVVLLVVVCLLKWVVHCLYFHFQKYKISHKIQS